MIKVGVIRGGLSDEHGVSMKTGESVLNNLSDKYDVHDIVLGKDGDWVFNRQFSSPDKIFSSVDVVFNALHGYHGEDGKIQHLLETFNVPYTGSGVLASALGMNKSLSRVSFVKSGLLVPRGVTVASGESAVEAARKIFGSIQPGWVIKPANGGSSIGVLIVKSFDDLVAAITSVLETGSDALVEERVAGREFTCGVVENMRGQQHYGLPVVEIIPPEKNDFFDYEAKYNGESQEICPADLDIYTKQEIEKMAIAAHESLGCRHYSRSDFILTPKGKIYLLEINTLPGLTSESLLPKSLKSAGVAYSDFLDHLINLALKK